MSSQQAPAAEFSFPSLSGTQPSTGTQSNPFAVQPAPAATRPAPPQVQLQTPVQPQSTEPLTARSTVVHASSRTAAAQAPQQQQQGGSLSQQPAAAAQKPVPISQARREVAEQRLWLASHPHTPGQGRATITIVNVARLFVLSLSAGLRGSWPHPVVGYYFSQRTLPRQCGNVAGVQCALSAWCCYCGVCRCRLRGVVTRCHWKRVSAKCHGSS